MNYFIGLLRKWLIVRFFRLNIFIIKINFWILDYFFDFGGLFENFIYEDIYR